MTVARLAPHTALATSIERLRTSRRLTLSFLDHLHLFAAAEARAAGGDAETVAERLLAAVPAGWVDGSIGWNLLHVAVFEEECAGQPDGGDRHRYRHGAEPAAAAAPLAAVVERLSAARAALLATLAAWSDATLDRPAGAAPGTMSRRQAIDAAVWHEPHHLNLCNEALRRLWVGGDG